MINTYIKKNVTKEWLLKNEFRYNRFFSTKEDTIYTYRFPVVYIKGKNKVSIECELLLYYPDGNVYINVYNAGTRDKYAPYYNSEYGDWSKMISTINNRIDSKLKKLGIITL